MSPTIPRLTSSCDDHPLQTAGCRFGQLHNCHHIERRHERHLGVHTIRRNQMTCMLCLRRREGTHSFSFRTSIAVIDFDVVATTNERVHSASTVGRVVVDILQKREKDKEPTKGHQHLISCRDQFVAKTQTTTPILDTTPLLVIPPPCVSPNNSSMVSTSTSTLVSIRACSRDMSSRRGGTGS